MTSEELRLTGKMGPAFELAFFIDQEVNINRQPIEVALNSAVNTFVWLHPEYRGREEELKARGTREFNSWYEN